jgi:type I restriction enzyme S subunit
MSRYESYKKTVIDWVGEIPSHWETLKPKYKLNRVTRPIDENDEVITCFRDGEVTLRKNRREDGFTNSIREHGYQQIKPGDLVVHEMDGFEGAIGISDSKGKSTPVYTVIEPNEKVDLSYIAYLLREMSEGGKIESLARSTRERTTDFRWNMWSIIPFPFPPINEQKSISVYLDKKTKQIKSLVGKIQNKIELLKEQRISLINQCVTKGIDPDVKMKNSCVDWIGDIPKHWKKSRIKYKCILKTGNSLNENQKEMYSSDSNEKITYISSKNIDSEKRIINYNTGIKLPLDEPGFTISPIGSFLIVVEGGSTGKKIGYQDRDVYYVNKLCSIFNLDKTKFIYYYFQSKIIKSFFEKSITGLIGGVSVNNIGNFFLPLPDTKEQKIISDYLDKKTNSLDLLISKNQRNVDLLEEYMKTLIFQIITGKIRITQDMA